MVYNKEKALTLKNTNVNLILIKTVSLLNRRSLNLSNKFLLCKPFLQYVCLILNYHCILFAYLTFTQ